MVMVHLPGVIVRRWPYLERAAPRRIPQGNGSPAEPRHLRAAVRPVDADGRTARRRRPVSEAVEGNHVDVEPRALGGSCDRLVATAFDTPAVGGAPVPVLVEAEDGRPAVVAGVAIGGGGDGVADGEQEEVELLEGSADELAERSGPIDDQLSVTQVEDDGGVGQEQVVE